MRPSIAPITESQLIELVREFANQITRRVREATEPLLERIAVLEARPVIDIPELLKGIDAAIAAAPRPDVKSEIAEYLAAHPPAKGEPGTPGKDADMGAISDIVKDAIATITEAVRPQLALDDEGIDKQIAARVIDYMTEHPAPKGEPGPAGQPGQPDPVFITETVARAVSNAIVKLPKPLTLEEMCPAFDEAVAKAIAMLPKAKDGVGLAGAIIGQDGVLNLTLTDGTLHPLGRVVGKDGERGKDGRDGFALDDLQIDQPDLRSAILRFVRGEDRKEHILKLPGFVDRGVYKPGESYALGDAVTWGGSLWLAQRQTTEKPETSDAWRLAVKRGRDGKDTVKTPPGPQGPVKA